MPQHQEEQLSPYSPEQIFALVADIERYPEFLPWCRAARIISRHGDIIEAELVISFKHFTESYISRVELKAPNEINVNMISGPFEYLINRWHFVPEGSGTRIQLSLDFKFRSKILESLIGGLFSRATAKMAGAFKDRADHLYGTLIS